MTVHGAAVPGEETFACICGKRLNPRQEPPAPQPEQVQEHGASAMPEEGIVLSEFRSRSMSWQPQMSMLCFSGLTLQLPLGSLQKWLVLLCKESWCGSLGLGIAHHCLWVSCVWRERGRHYHGEAQCHLVLSPIFLHPPACPLLSLSPLPSSSVLLLLHG